MTETRRWYCPACASTRVTLPDFENLQDCADCGIWFPAKCTCTDANLPRHLWCDACKREPFLERQDSIALDQVVEQCYLASTYDDISRISERLLRRGHGPIVVGNIEPNGLIPMTFKAPLRELLRMQLYPVEPQVRRKSLHLGTKLYELSKDSK